MSGIFISYRRGDSLGFAGRLEDDLSERFGDMLVFRDREIPVGADFTQILNEKLAAIDVMLVMIGRDWENVRDNNGKRRLHHPDDWVRREIEVALERGIPVIPVLVGNTSMPSAFNLPESLSEFSKRQAFPLSDRRWHEEIDELARQLTRFSNVLKTALHNRGVVKESQSVADAIRDIGDRVIDEAIKANRQEEESERSRPRGSFTGFFFRLFGKSLAGVIAITIIYFIIRSNGDEKLNRQLDYYSSWLLQQLKVIFAG